MRQALRAIHASAGGRWATQKLCCVWSGGSRWLNLAALTAFTALVLALAVPVLILRLHPSVSQAVHLLLNLLLSGMFSVLLAGFVRWFIGRASLERMQAQVTTAIVLGVLVIAANAVMLPGLMFSARRDMDLLLVVVAFGIAVALAVSLPLGARIARPVVRVEQGARRIASGEYCVRILEGELSNVEELTRLARSINQMASDIQHADARRQIAETHLRQTITAISHDLRTPLCSIQLGLEAIADGVVIDPVAVKQYHAELLAEVLRLNALVGALFELARLESGALVLTVEPIDIEEVIADAVEAMRVRTEQGKAHITYQVESGLPPVSAEAVKIHRVLSSLLENALRYTPSGGAILVRATKPTCDDQKQALLVQVIDTGTGIGADDLSHVFEPLYRCEPSRKRQTAVASGAHVDVEVGLGLTLAAHVVEAHGGQIWATSPLPREARALVALRDDAPLDDAPHALDAPSSMPGTMVSFTLPAACT